MTVKGMILHVKTLQLKRTLNCNKKSDFFFIYNDLKDCILTSVRRHWARFLPIPVHRKGYHYEGR